MTVEVGDVAPDFTLRNQDNEEVTLSSFRGSKDVILVFYPFAFSGICSGELCQVRDDLPAFQNDDAQLLAISVDTVYSLKTWAAEQGFSFPLLSDFWPHGEVAQQYGSFFSERGFAVRGTFVIDKAGVVTFAEVNGPGEARDQTRW